MATDDKEFRLFDFNVYAEEQSESDSENSEGSRTKPSKDSSSFMIQMFGINEKGETCCIFVNGFKPYFYAKVAENWTQSHKNKFMRFIQDKLGKYYENSLTGCKLIKKKKLYGFDGGKEHKFVRLEFENINAFNKAKGLWYGAYVTSDNGRSDRKMKEEGLVFEKTNTYLYEANIPPLLRFFHIQEVSPSGWVSLPKRKTLEKKYDTQTSCTCIGEFWQCQWT